MKGVYALVIQIEQNLTSTIGALGEIEFRKGIWIYVGSAMGAGSTNLENRISRHFRDEKTVHWHIDHLLKTNAIPLRVVWAESDQAAECDLAEEMKKSPLFVAGPRGFGASDCTRGCGTHLFRFAGPDNLERNLQEILSDLGLNPHVTEKDNTVVRNLPN